jgi:type I restriction enzyme S subunit
MEQLTTTEYKQTEVGLIPNDWDFIKIQSLIDKGIITSHLDGNHGALYPRSNEFTNFGVPYITANDFANGRLNFKKVRYLPHFRAEQFQKGIAKDGDVLFAHNATVGPTVVLKTSFDYVILSTSATYFRVSENDLNNYYLRYFFESELFVRQYSAVMRQSTRNQIPITQQRKFSVILPSHYEEQKAIAQVLSDTDALIQALEKKIAKKKLIKKGLIQRLLKPKKDWVTKSLGEIGIVTGAGVDKKIKDNEEKVTLLNYMDVFRNDYLHQNIFNHEVTTHYSKLISCNVLKGDIFLTPSSETRTDIGISALSMEDMEGIVYSYHVNRLRYNIEIDEKFGLYMLKTKAFLNQAETLCEGSGKRYVLSLSKFRKLEVSYPENIDKQKEISSIIYSMDLELEQLKQKLSKYQLAKDGMMQQLLTGKIRLV